ncbi:hypothetical protein VFPPC_17566 [Pochonia chlamydosporia 170]|uniref:Uncharacterized protein n=1 Tax=Pochonia chlamydosporia 170 TaxID=1380566 RepID=A0A219AR74_METCM|nr:hypothetical protein VFPPC_17566 [Pochonia chlamydosporia 170]OWT43271.1 hypothetical protein VFPPC_17566 [Pochonia chlamydosporia 170]
MALLASQHPVSTAISSSCLVLHIYPTSQLILISSHQGKKERKEQREPFPVLLFGPVLVTWLGLEGGDQPHRARLGQTSLHQRHTNQIYIC